MAGKPLFTIGYSGFTAEQFVDKLKNVGVQVVVDVRQLPLSRKRGFSKTRLREHLDEHEIEYVHLRDLGVPGRLRRELRNGGDLGDYLNDFRTYLAGCDDTLESLHELAQAKPCCLMCVEHDVGECHRSVVAEALLLRNGRKLKVRHL